MGHGITVKSSEAPEASIARINRVIENAVAGSRCHKDAAAEIKLKMDDMEGPGWVCVLGKSYGAYFAHEPGTFHHASLNNGDVSVLIWKSP